MTWPTPKTRDEEIYHLRCELLKLRNINREEGRLWISKPLLIRHILQYIHDYVWILNEQIEDETYHTNSARVTLCQFQIFLDQELNDNRSREDVDI